MSQDQLWPEIYTLQGKLGALYQEQVPGLWEKHGLNNVPGAFILINSAHAGPDGLDPKEISYRNPYSNPQALADNLQGLMDAGYLDTIKASRYVPSSSGAQAVSGLMADFATMFTEPTPAAEEDLQRLTDLLQKLVQASLEAPPPPPKTALLASRRLDRGPDAPIMAALNRAIGDLNAFRDDAHLASWRGLGVSGKEWEALTAIWNDTADNPEKLAETFSFRQYEETDYEEALAALADRGWVIRNGKGDYALTESGRAIREEAENVTNRTFYACWTCLNDKELAELKRLIDRVGEAFQPQ